MARISPAATSRLMSSTVLLPWASNTDRFSTTNAAAPGSAGSFETVSCTSRPTINAASSVLPAVGFASPTTLPSRMTVILSATSRTSRSLWVMNTMVVPDAASSRMIRIRSSVSCGVSTAVGSSNTSTLASRESALTISTRCCTPTGRSSTRASGSRSKPNLADISRTSFRAATRSSRPPSEVVSLPSTMFSATVNTGISMKC
ncbi:unannotated protein [freshwater metagenome]|uniref:Unannotated protein n=1 Tax=freshwater metagenome TaxID=449393 RepID=A0A6J7HWW5_9ZZZZ